MVRYIALCGAPKAGKTEAARVLERTWGITPIDDKAPLRDAVKILYGLTDWHVHTQDGKASLVDVNGTMMDVRTILGELGLYLEERDPYHFPKLALSQAANRSDGPFCFPSVRKDQARIFRETNEALVVEITRPGFEPFHAFDRYDRSLVDVTIANTWSGPDWEERFGEALTTTLAPYFAP